MVLYYETMDFGFIDDCDCMEFGLIYDCDCIILCMVSICFISRNKVQSQNLNLFGDVSYSAIRLLLLIMLDIYILLGGSPPYVCICIQRQIK